MWKDLVESEEVQRDVKGKVNVPFPEEILPTWSFDVWLGEHKQGVLTPYGNELRNTIAQVGRSVASDGNVTRAVRLLGAAEYVKALEYMSTSEWSFILGL